MNKILKFTTSTALGIIATSGANASMAPASYDCSKYTPEQAGYRTDGNLEGNVVAIAYSAKKGRMKGSNANCADVLATKYDAEGYAADGFNEAGWNREGINKTTGTLYNEDGLNQRGFASGGCYGKSGSCTGDDGHSHPVYDPEGYDAWGYDKNGYDKDGNPSGNIFERECPSGPNSPGCRWWEPIFTGVYNQNGDDYMAQGHWGSTGGCFSADTPITLADGTIKRADEIGYDDELLVWNFDEGKFDKAKPLWLKVAQITDCYNYLRFSDGSIFKTIDQHRIFNKEAGKFTYPMTDETPLGTHTLNAKGEWVELVEKKVIQEEVVYYNIITDFHINCFAGNVLASCRFNNLYPIKNLKFVKDNRVSVPYEEYAELDRKWYDGLRLSEQPREVNNGNDVHHAESVVEHIQNVYIKNAQS